MLKRFDDRTVNASALCVRGRQSLIKGGLIKITTNVPMFTFPNICFTFRQKSGSVMEI